MTSSPTLGHLFAALSAAQAEIKFAVKDSTGQVGTQKTRYADLTSVWDACRAPLANHKLAVTQLPFAEGNKVTVVTVLGHASGEWIETTLTVVARDASPQAIGSAITYARRYTLAPMVGVTADDDDGHAAQPTQQQARPAQPPAAAPAKPPTITAARVKQIGVLAGRLALDPAKFSQHLEARFGVAKLAMLDEAQADVVQAGLVAKITEKESAKPAAPPIPQYVRAFSAKLVGSGLAMDGELEQTLDGAFGEDWGTIENWPDEIRDKVRAACLEFERGALAAMAHANGASEITGTDTK